MASIFSMFKDSMLDFIDSGSKYNLKMPLPKTRNALGNYTRGDFIVVGGRKTSGKSSFMLHNYITSPLIQRITTGKTEKPFKTHVIYINSRKSAKATIERMVVNYVSTKNKGNKLGVPSLYGFQGRHAKISPEKAKAVLTSTMGIFDTLINKHILTVLSAKKTIFEIEDVVQSVMSQYGTFENADDYEFVYNEKDKDVIPILVIDDITSIIGEGGGPVMKFENAHKLGIKLKTMAKALNMVVVLAVPSLTKYTKGAFHKSSVEEVEPYHLYADRVVIMHNPMETGDSKVLGYEIKDFVNKVTGISYFRMLFVASNYMGASGIYIPYFMYPENGFLLELPSYDDDRKMEKFYDIVDK